MIVPAALLLGAAALVAHGAFGTLVGLGAPPTLPVAAKMQLPLVFLTMHVSYGSGYLLGLLAVAKGSLSTR
jgi:hypothetical protein